MKKVILIIAIIFSLSFFTGCSNENVTNAQNLNFDDYIMLSLDISSSGQVVQSLTFSINSHYIDKHAKNENEKLDFISNLVKQVSEIRTEFLFGYTIKYIQNPKEEYKLNKGLLLSNAVYNDENDTVGFNILFTSIGAWNYYHQVSSANQTNNSSQNKGENIFLKKNSSLGTFPFSSEVKLGETESIYVGERYRQKYLSASSNLSFSQKIEKDYSPTFIYNYSTFYSRLRSDANCKLNDNRGNIHHIWTVDYDELSSENKINIYSYSINTGMWYLFALIIALLVTLIAILIAYRKEIKSFIKNKKRLKLKIINKKKDK